MILTTANVVSFLLNAGLLEAASIVDGNLVVEEAHRRNRNFKVSSRNKNGYFVKQVQRWEPEALSTLQMEAECYRLASGDETLNGLKALLPEYIHYDRARCILVMELLDNAESFSEHRNSTGAIPAAAAGELGEAFGRYHRLGIDLKPGTALERALARRTPWVLHLQQMAQGNGMQHSAANRQMIQILLRFPEFAAHFDRLAQEWQYRCLIHGDVKWDNCMLTNTESGLKAKIIDWELANWGDPAWDVGCIFAAFLAGWIQALPPSATRVPGQFDAFSERCLAEMQPSVHAFWNAYCAARNPPEAACRSYLLQCLRYGAARLVQTAYEHLQFSSAVDANTYLLLQGSCNMLTHPDEAVEELLSL